MLCLADRHFFGHALWQAAAITGADLLWRVKGNLRLPRATVLADGSYLSVVYPSEKDRRHATNGVRVRVVEYRLEGVADAEPLYRLVTTILDEAQAPAADLAALYHERWEVDIDQALRLSRIKGWMVLDLQRGVLVEHCECVFSPVRIRAVDRRAIAGRRGRAVPARRRGVRRARCRQDWRASCRATPDIGRGSL